MCSADTYRRSTLEFEMGGVSSFMEQVEYKIKSELAELRKELENEEAKVRELDSYYQKESKRILERDEISPLELSLYNGYLKGIRARIEEGKKFVQECRKRAEDKEGELVEVAYEKKRLLYLKNNDQKECRKELPKIEERMIDEESVKSVAGEDEPVRGEA